MLFSRILSHLFVFFHYINNLFPTILSPILPFYQLHQQLSPTNRLSSPSIFSTFSYLSFLFTNYINNPSPLTYPPFLPIYHNCINNPSPLTYPPFSQITPTTFFHLSFLSSNIRRQNLFPLILLLLNR